MAGDKFPFPIISFQPFLTGSKAEQEALAKELYNAFHTYGWVYLKDFGISQEEINESFKYVSGPRPLSGVVLAGSFRTNHAAPERELLWLANGR